MSTEESSSAQVELGAYAAQSNSQNKKHRVNYSKDSDYQKLDGDGFYDLDGKVSYSLIRSFAHIVSASVPTVLSMLFFQSVAVMNIIFIGQSDDSDLLAGVGLGAMLLNVCWFAVSQGLNGALETYISQLYGGQHYHLCGVYLNRARAILTVVLSPVAIMFLFSDKILIAAGQDPKISKMARDYVVWCLPGVYAQSLFDCVRRYLQSMLMSKFSTYCTIITTLLHAFWCWLFVIYLKFSVLGVALALNITYISCYFAQEYIYRIHKRKDFEMLLAPLWSKETWSGWCEYLKLAVPSTLMQCFEWWAFELIAIFAGLLSVKDLAAQVAIINTIGIVYMIPLGVQFAASGMVGNMIGARNPKQAQKYALCAVLLAVIIVSIVAIVFNIIPEIIGGIFTKDVFVIDIVVRAMPVMTSFLVLDSIHGAQCGNVKALGRQLPQSIFSLIAYYVFGMPLAIIFGFKMGMGVIGFWLAYMLALITLDMFGAYLVIYAQWTPKTVQQVEDDQFLIDDNEESFKVGKQQLTEV